jgi:hypothetical protein
MFPCTFCSTLSASPACSSPRAPPPMSWDSLYPSRTYICVTKQLLILDTIQKYLRFFFIFIEKHKKVKYIKIFLTNITVGGTRWKRHVQIPSIVNPTVRVVVNGYDLSAPPKKELIIVGVGTLSPPSHPSTSVHRDMVG